MDVELLEDLINKGKSSHQIASILGKSQTTIRYWLKKHSLKTQYKRKKRPKIFCRDCSKELLENKVYCNSECQLSYQHRLYIERWKNGEESGLVGKVKAVSGYIRKWIFKTRNNKCEHCGWNKRSKHSNRIPLQIDHIDGNFLNNRPENLRLLCPNCHSLTPTWGGLNGGKNCGRRKHGCM